MPWTCGLGDEAVLGGRGDQGLARGEGTAGDGRELCESPLPQSFWEQLPLPACPCLCCLELSLPGALSLSPGLLPLSAHRPHPTRSVLSSALQTPPGSRTLPRDISVCAEATEQLR